MAFIKDYNNESGIFMPNAYWSLGAITNDPVSIPPKHVITFRIFKDKAFRLAGKPPVAGLSITAYDHVDANNVTRLWWSDNFTVGKMDLAGGNIRKQSILFAKTCPELAGAVDEI